MQLHLYKSDRKSVEVRFFSLAELVFTRAEVYDHGFDNLELISKGLTERIVLTALENVLIYFLKMSTEKTNQLFLSSKTTNLIFVFDS